MSDNQTLSGERPTQQVARIAMPEWITRLDDNPQAWTVQEGQPVRGDAWTDLSQHTMRVPTGNDKMSRVVRAHEMMHAKVSPKSITPTIANQYKVGMESIVSGEEFRVNMLVGEAGFDLDDLRDGSESNAGKRAAENSDWNSAVYFLSAISGTRAAADFLRGVTSINPDMAKALRVVQKTLVKHWRAHKKSDVKRIGSTAEWRVSVGESEEVLTDGFRFALKYAQIVESFLIKNTDDEYGNREIPDVERITKEGKSGHFARLIEDVLPKPVSVNGKLGRKRIASNIGRNPRRIQRMLTDPDQRVFDRRAKGRGGVVLIDQSSSMNLTKNELWQIINSAPGAVIIGYSHRPGSATEPNVWVLADRGKVVDTIRTGNGGNGVDAPAIRFAQKRRKAGEPFIWVCDGLVTDGAKDSPDPILDEECARLVHTHNIHMVKDIDEAVASLQRAANGERLGSQYVGGVRRAARSLSFI